MTKGSMSTVSEIMANGEAVKIIEKYATSLVSDSRINMAMGMKLKAAAPFVGGKLNKEVLSKIDKELKEL